MPALASPVRLESSLVLPLLVDPALSRLDLVQHAVVLAAMSRSRPVRAIRARVAQLPCPRAAPLLQMVQVELCSSLLDQVALVAMCSFAVARVARVRVVMSTLPLVQVSPRRVRCPFRLEARQTGRLVLCD